jgi:hypothetical protein
MGIDRTQQALAIERVGHDRFHSAGAECRYSTGIADQAENGMAACEQQARQRRPESAVGSGKQDFHNTPRLSGV